MSSPLAFVAGLAGILFLLMDVIWTTLGEGAGPLTRLLTSGQWRLALRLHRIRNSHGLLAGAGIALVLNTLFLLVLLLWLAWFLVFLGDTGAVVHGQTKLPAEVWDRLYFAGVTLFTLGAGPFEADGTLFRLLTPFATFSGLFVVTFAITYLVPVAQAATHRRALAVRLFTLGRTPQEILLRAWNGRDFSRLTDLMSSVAQDLALLEQRHLTYPMLHYFHAAAEKEAIPLRLAALDEALTLMQHGVDQTPGVEHVEPVRRLVQALLGTLEEAFIHPAEKPPPVPRLAPLAAAGIPVVSDAAWQSAVAGLSRRRRLLLGFVQNDGWAWESVQLPPDGERAAPEPPAAGAAD